MKGTVEAREADGSLQTQIDVVGIAMIRMLIIWCGQIFTKNFGSGNGRYVALIQVKSYRMVEQFCLCCQTTWRRSCPFGCKTNVQYFKRNGIAYKIEQKNLSVTVLSGSGEYQSVVVSVLFEVSFGKEKTENKAKIEYAYLNLLSAHHHGIEGIELEN